MLCYHCGCRLSEHDYCTACGADVSLYKKIIYVSNMYYNEGLERAKVRDLSGATTSLRQSLKFNKNNIKARNLLGLVYFEMGEAVCALREWVISKNLCSEKNIADYYIGIVQSNSARLEAINQTAKKFNQALTYCKQDSKDLAILQLKKVLSLNPRFVQAHQLLALIYINHEDWERAKKELKKCMDIDRNNTMTLRYMQEVDLILESDKTVKPVPRRKNDSAVRYKSDNEMIIQPLNVKEPKSATGSSLLNIFIGLVIGLAAMYFLVMPAAVTGAKNEAQVKLVEMGNELDARTSAINELEAQISQLQTDNNGLQEQLDAYVGTGGTLQMFDSLLNAAAVYVETQDVAQTAASLEAIAASTNVEETSQAFQQLYQALLNTIGPELSETYYNEGYAAYRNNNFTEAIEKLEKAVYYNVTNAEALYNLAEAYRQSGDIENAITRYQKVIELFPDTERARRSQRYIDELTEE